MINEKFSFSEIQTISGPRRFQVLNEAGDDWDEIATAQAVAEFVAANPDQLMQEPSQNG